MPPYSILLFDADNTLFNFDAGNRRAFSEVCRTCHLPDTDELFHAYEKPPRGIFDSLQIPENP